jgi:hypothetical protein
VKGGTEMQPTREMYDSYKLTDHSRVTVDGCVCHVLNFQDTEDGKSEPEKWDVWFETIVPPCARIIHCDFSSTWDDSHVVYEVPTEKMVVG